MLYTKIASTILYKYLEAMRARINQEKLVVYNLKTGFTTQHLGK